MKIGSYEIIEKITTNPTKTIYRVMDSKNQHLIIKQLNFAVDNNDEYSKLKKEMQILEHLDSQFVVKCIDIGEYEGCPFLVMEDKGGIDLKSYIRNYNLNLFEFLNLAMRMAEALNHVHIHNVIHMDVNPTNFIINPISKRIWLNDFGVAEYYQKSTRYSTKQTEIIGTIEYISPEQTGRINATIDYRADIYALGVSFYEMCTGNLPFKADDLLTNIHLHVAVMPVRPDQIAPSVPKQVSKIIMKMLSKEPIKRYQSGFGLIDDLKLCQKSLQDTGAVQAFDCGATDRYSYFNYPSRIYGRSVLLQDIASLIKRGINNSSQMLLVEGEAGIGKTYIINRFLNERKDCLLVSGEFSEGIDTPFSAFIEAIRAFFTSQLMMSDEYIQALKESIHITLGTDATILTSLIPELRNFYECEVSEEAQLDVGFYETQFRLHDQLAKVFEFIIQREGNLVLVLDNIHYIDEASLSLLEYLIEKADLTRFIIIGLSHPNTELALLENLRVKCREHLNYKRIEMSGYEIHDIQELVHDLFSFDESQSQVLSDILMTKTRGVPLFVYNMLKALYIQNIIFFDIHLAKWSFELNSVKQFQTPQNVIEHVLKRMDILEEDGVSLLHVASCFESDFNLSMLNRVGGFQLERLIDALIILIDNEFFEYDGSINDLIFMTPHFDERMIRFSHASIRSVVNHIMDPDFKMNCQFKIGLEYYVIYKKLPNPDQIPRIVKCFSQSKELVTDKILAREIAELNYLLAYQARSSAAFEQAEHYISSAAHYLDYNAFETAYDLAFRIFLLKAEIEYLTKLFNRAESDFTYLLSQTKSDLDYARVNKMRLTLYVNQGETDKVIDLAMKTLNKLGVKLKEGVTIWAVIGSLVSIKSNRTFNAIEPLEQLPECTQPEIELIMAILMTLISVSYLYSKLLFIQIILKMIELSLKHGNGRYSSFAYATYGIIEGNLFGRYDRGFAYGEMSIRLAKRYKNSDVLSQTHFTMGFFLNHWENHIRGALPYLIVGREQSEKCGDMVYFAYSVAAYHLANIASSAQLDSIIEVINADLKKINEVQVYDVTNLLISVRQLVLNLKGKTKGLTRFDSDNFDQNIFEISLRESKMPSIWAVYIVMKAKMHYLYDYYDEAFEMFKDGDRLFSNLMGLFQSVEYLFYQTLILLKINKTDPRIPRNIKKLKKFASVAPSNFEHMYLIAKAERFRTDRHFEEAKHYFDQGLKISHQNDFILEEALCCEMLASIYAQEVNVKQRKLYLFEAHTLFARIGATAKLRFMEEKYREIVFVTKEVISSHGLNTYGTNSIKASTEKFDLLSIIKSSQSLSAVVSEVHLVDEAMHIILQVSNADRAVLIIKDEQLSIRAIAEGTSKVYTYQKEPVKGSGLVPESIINYAMRSEEPLIVDHIETSHIYKRDTYFTKNAVKSVLCVPLLHKDSLFGLIYLENSLLSGAFGYNRLESLNVILSQFIISYENAKLIETKERSEAEIRFHKNHLEELVSQRTSELSIAKSDIEEIMNNVDQGFMQFDQTGHVLDGYSRECIKMFSYRLDGMDFDTLFNQSDKGGDKGFYLKIIKKIFEVEHDFSANVYLGLLPDMLNLNGKHIQVHYKLVRNDFYKRIIVIMTDMTERTRLEFEKEAEKQNLKKIVNIIKYKSNLKKNIEEYKAFFSGGYSGVSNGNVSLQEGLKEIYRIVHTFKGDFAQWSMNHLSDSLHALEENIVQLSRRSNYTHEDVAELIENFNSSEVLDEEFEKVFEYTGRAFFDSEETIQISKKQMDDIASELIPELTTTGESKLNTIIKRLQYVNAKDMLLQYQEYARLQADQMNKQLSGIIINGDDVYLDRDIYYDFFRSLIHVIRNIIQYAVELPDVRSAAGKLEAALITCDIHYTAMGFKLVIADDGSGIDLEKVEEKAKELNLLNEETYYEEDDLLQILFHHGFSTSDEATKLSGRGIGLSAVKDETDKLGGTIKVRTVITEGTLFEFMIPLDHDYLNSFH